MLSRRNVKEVLVVLDKEENEDQPADFVLRDRTSRQMRDSLVPEAGSAPPLNGGQALAPAEPDPGNISLTESVDTTPQLTPDSEPSSPHDLTQDQGSEGQHEPEDQNTVTQNLLELDVSEIAPATATIGTKRLVSTLMVGAAIAAVAVTKLPRDASILTHPISSIRDVLGTTTTVTIHSPKCTTKTETLVTSSISTTTATKTETRTKTAGITTTQTIHKTAQVTKSIPQGDSKALASSLRDALEPTSEDRAILSLISWRKW